MTHSLLLLVEDDDRYRETLARALANRGFEVVEARSVGTAATTLDTASGGAFDFAVIDLKLPDGSGLAVLQELRAKSPQVRAVMLTGWGSIAAALEAVRLGAIDFLTKPAAAEEVTRALREGTARPEPATGSPDVETPSLDRVEWEHIQRVLSRNDGNVSQAARELGLHRRSLQRKLTKRPPAR